jgi:hypothetical protein
MLGQPTCGTLLSLLLRPQAGLWLLEDGKRMFDLQRCSCCCVSCRNIGFTCRPALEAMSAIQPATAATAVLLLLLDCLRVLQRR